MAQALGLDTVAEGVETEEQLEGVTALACDYVQGYHLSRPLPAARSWKRSCTLDLPCEDLRAPVRRPARARGGRPRRARAARRRARRATCWRAMGLRARAVHRRARPRVRGGRRARAAPTHEVALIPPVSGGAGPVRLVEVTDEPLDLGVGRGRRARPARRRRRAASRASPATSRRSTTRPTPRWPRAKMQAIGEEEAARHGLCAVALVHRTGRVPLSEPSVIVAASAPHRGEAFAGARALIDRVKAEAPIWKVELDARGRAPGRGRLLIRHGGPDPRRGRAGARRQRGHAAALGSRGQAAHHARRAQPPAGPARGGRAALGASRARHDRAHAVAPATASRASCARSRSTA